MNLPDNLLGETWYWAAWAVWIACFALCVLKAPWGRLRDAEQLNVWAGMVVVLTLLWSLKAGVRPGLDFHLLGATVFTLSCGPHLAFVGLSLVAAATVLNGDAGYQAFALNGLLVAGVGVGVSQMLHRLLFWALPKHFFVYVFANGFLGAALTIVCVGLCATVFLASLDVYAWDYLFSEYFPYFFLLAFSEAWLSGMLMTLFVIYRPNWVLTFDDSRYLTNK